MFAGVDVTNDTSLEQLLQKLGYRPIDLLIIAAGSQETDKLETVTKDNIRRQMEANAIGPLFTVKGLQDKLKKGSKVFLRFYFHSLSPVYLLSLARVNGCYSLNVVPCGLVDGHRIA